MTVRFNPRNSRPAALYLARKRQVAQAAVDYAGSLTVGNGVLSFGFVQGSIGAIAPTDWGGAEFQEITVDLADFFVVQFVGGQQKSGINKVRCQLPTLRGAYIDTVWNGTNTRYEGLAPGFTALISNEENNVLPITFQGLAG